MDNPMTITEWVKQNKPDDEMFACNSFYDQVDFVKFSLGRIFENIFVIQVVGSHMSKSVLFPVYYIDLGDIKIWMRNNLYNWNVSVKSNYPIKDYLGVLHDDMSVYCFCEGMEEYRFGKHCDNPCEFTMWFNSDCHDLYCFMLTLRKMVKEQANG